MSPVNIRKRTGEVVPFQEEKILNAIKKAFSGQGQEIDDRALDEMLSVVLKRLPENGGLTVERVQDEVERVLMECGHYEVAKAYILYREKRAALRRIRADLAREVGDDALEDLLRQIQKDFEEEIYPLSTLQLKFDFLGDGEYQATIYTDAKDVNENANHLNKEVRKVTKKDVIELPLAVDGGSVVHIIKL